MSLTDYQTYISTLLQNPAEEAEFFAALDQPLPKSLHLLQSRISTEEFLGQNRDWTLTPPLDGQLPHTYYVDRSDRSLPLGSTRWHQSGYYYIQEVAASIPAHFVDIPPHALILDMCAAPGGKTIQLADRMAREQPDAIGCVRSNDVDPKRISVLAANLNRSGLPHTTISKINGTSFGVVFPETFDSILLDAPCSGEGTGYKSASAYERRSQKGVRDIANLQQSLLHSAAKACKVGGSIVYSTCTLNHRENESQIARLLETYPDAFEIENIHLPSTQTALTHYQDQELISDTTADKCIRCRPHRQHTGGFFVTKIRKLASIAKPYTYDKAKTKQTHFSTPLTHTKAESKAISRWLQDLFGIEIDPHRYTFVSSQKTVFLTSPTILPFLSIARFEKVGIPIAKIITNRKSRDPRDQGQRWYIPLQHVANTLGHLATQNIIPLTPSQAQSYSEGNSIHPDDISDRSTLQDGQYYLLTCQGLPLSVTKYTGGFLKNKFTGV